jgi:hypothetical protein
VLLLGGVLVLAPSTFYDIGLDWIGDCLIHFVIVNDKDIRLSIKCKVIKCKAIMQSYNRTK